jgi:hypothetical protein
MTEYLVRQCLRQAISGKVSNSIHSLYVEPRNLPEQKSYLIGPIKFSGRHINADILSDG